MKKRMDEEKLALIDEACELINESIEKLSRAKKLLHLCGIEICGIVDIEKQYDWCGSGSNIQIFSGLPRLEKLTGATAVFPPDLNEKPDRSRKRFDYKGIRFLQVGKVQNSGYKFK